MVHPISQKRKRLGRIFLHSLNPTRGHGHVLFILNEEEQFGGSKGGSSNTNYLQELMFELNAIDLGYSGNKYT